MSKEDSNLRFRPDKLARLWSVGALGNDQVSLPPVHIEGYRIIEEIGEGGMGIVYLAEQGKPIKRQVALKIIKPGMDSKQVIARFEAERQTLALLDHPNIAHIYNAGSTSSGRPYFVMEYVEGLPITDFCDQNKLSIEERLRLFIQVCEAIQHAHQKGIIHRDIKPSNVLITTQDEKTVPKVIDFGIAKAISQQMTEHTIFTEQGQLVGTPEYMSPEQIELTNQNIDTRSDIYSLGILLYELLTGALPFDTETLRKAAFGEIQKIIKEQDPPKPSTKLSHLGDDIKDIVQNRRTQLPLLVKRLHKELEWIPLMAIRKERDRRYKSAADLAEDIQNYLEGNVLIAGPESAGYKISKFIRRNRTSAVVGFVVFASLIIGLSLAIVGFIQASRQRDLAKAEFQRAEANFQKAHKVVDEMTDVAEGLLANMSQIGQVRRQLLQKTQAFYEGLLEEKSNDPAVREDIGRAYKRLGNINRLLGQYQLAEQAFYNAIDTFESFRDDSVIAPEYKHLLAVIYLEISFLGENNNQLVEAMQTAKNSVELYKELVADFPNSIEYRQLLGASLFHLGIMLRDNGKIEESIQAHQEGIRIQGQLVEEFPDSIKYIKALAHTYYFIALPLEGVDRWEELKPYVSKALELMLPIVDKLPGSDNMYELGTTYHYLGDMYFRTDQNLEAKQAYAQSIIIRKELAENYPSIHNYRQILAESSRNVTGILVELGQLDEAVETIRESAKLFKALYTDFPRNPYFRDNMIGNYNWLADLLTKSGRYEEAEHAYSELIGILEELAEKFPNEPRYRSKMASILNQFAASLKTSGRLEKSEQAFLQAINISEELTEDFPDEPSYRNELSIELRSFAEFLRSSGHYEESEQALQRTQRHVLFLNDKYPNNPDYREELALYHHILGGLMASTKRNTQAVEAWRESIRLFKQLIAELGTDQNNKDYRYRDERYGSNQAHCSRNLGSVLRTMGRLEKSKASYNQALQLFKQLAVDYPKFAGYQDEVNRIRQTLADLEAIAEISEEETKDIKNDR